MAVGKKKDSAGWRDHREALASAKKDLPPLVVISGENEFLRARAAGEIMDAWLSRYPGGDIILLRGAGDARQASTQDLASELSGGSLFAGEKLVMVRQAEKILFPQSGRTAEEAEDRKEKGSERDKAFLERLDNPVRRIWLVAETAQLPKNRTLGKRMAERCFGIPCPNPGEREIPGFLRARAGDLGRDIDDAAVDLLVRAHGTDLGKLSSEMDKLSLFAGDGARIDAAMAGEFLTGTIEFDIFGFTNAIEARDAEAALFYVRRITMQGARDQKGKREDGEKSAHRIMIMLSGTVQSLLRARAALSRGIDAGSFAAREKLSPWRAERLRQASRAFGLRELRLMAAFAADQVRRSHDTGGDAQLALELMAVKFTCPPAGAAGNA